MSDVRAGEEVDDTGLNATNRAFVRTSGGKPSLFGPQKITKVPSIASSSDATSMVDIKLPPIPRLVSAPRPRCSGKPFLAHEIALEIAKHVGIKNFFIKARKRAAVGDPEIRKMLCGNQVAWDMLKLDATHGSNSYRPQIRGNMTSDGETIEREMLYLQHLRKQPRAHLYDWQLRVDKDVKLNGNVQSSNLDTLGMLRATYFAVGFGSTLIVYDICGKRAFAIRTKDKICSFCITEKIVAVTTSTILYTARLEDLESISRENIASGISGIHGRHGEYDVQLDRMSQMQLRTTAKECTAGMAGAEYKLVFITTQGLAAFNQKTKLMIYRQHTQVCAVYVEPSHFQSAASEEPFVDHIVVFHSDTNENFWYVHFNWLLLESEPQLHEFSNWGSTDIRRLSSAGISHYKNQPSVRYEIPSAINIQWSDDFVENVAHHNNCYQTWKAVVYRADQYSLKRMHHLLSRGRFRSYVKDLFINDTFLIYQGKDDCLVILTFESPSVVT